MYHTDVALRDLVIVRPSDFIVPPVTQVRCFRVTLHVAHEFTLFADAGDLRARFARVFAATRRAQDGS